MSIGFGQTATAALVIIRSKPGTSSFMIVESVKPQSCDLHITVTHDLPPGIALRVHVEVVRPSAVARPSAPPGATFQVEAQQIPPLGPIIETFDGQSGLIERTRSSLDREQARDEAASPIVLDVTDIAGTGAGHAPPSALHDTSAGMAIAARTPPIASIAPFDAMRIAMCLALLDGHATMRLTDHLEVLRAFFPEADASATAPLVEALTQARESFGAFIDRLALKLRIPNAGLTAGDFHDSRVRAELDVLFGLLELNETAGSSALEAAAEFTTATLSGSLGAGARAFSGYARAACRAFTAARANPDVDELEAARRALRDSLHVGAFDRAPNLPM